MNLRLIIAIISLTGIATGQQLLKGSGSELLLRPSDAAVIEDGSLRSELACTVTPIKPKLELDFLFHSGFQVSMALKDLDTGIFGDNLTILFRVVAQDQPENPVLLSQKLRVPAMDRDQSQKSTFEFKGFFRLGEGKYHVDWMMRDKAEHICSKSWDIDARLGSKDSPLRAWTRTALVKGEEAELFSEEAPVTRKTDGVSVDMLVNFAPHDPASAVLDASDLQGVVAILREIARDPNILSYSVVACSIPIHKVLYRQETGPQIDLPILGESLNSLKLGRIAAKDLGLRDSHTAFVADVVRNLAANSASDALILVGPRMAHEPAADGEIAEALRDIRRPVFYLNYDSGNLTEPWQDLLRNAVKHAHGSAYAITTPRDLFGAWSSVMDRIMRSKRTSQSARATGN